MKSIIYRKNDWTIFRLVIVFLILVLIFSCITPVISLYYEDKQINFIQSLYFVVMTMTTLGGDIVLTSTVGRIFSIIIAITGIIMFFALVFPIIMIPWIEKRLQRDLPTKLLEKPNDHIIICGYNEMVESLVHELEDHQISFIVIDNDKEQIRMLGKKGIKCLFGDPTDENVLAAGRVCSAKLLIANQSDEKNASIILSAREDCEIEIIAIVNNKNNANYLKYAGANRVLSPKALLGSFIGQKAISPLTDSINNSIHFMPGLEIAEFPIYPGSPLIKKSLIASKIRELTGSNIVGIWKSGTLSLNPKSTDIIKRNSILLAVGSKEQLKKLKKLTH
jgi:voltage-gated potassium channel